MPETERTLHPWSNCEPSALREVLVICQRLWCFTRRLMKEIICAERHTRYSVGYSDNRHAY